MNKWFNNRAFLVVISFAMTLLLFSYVDSIGNRHQQSINVQSQQVVEHVPVEANLSAKRFVVTGLPSETSVLLEGPTSSVKLATTNRNFKVVTPNLDRLGEGDHTIDLKTQGLPADVQSRVSPKQVTIHIEPLEEKTFKVVIYTPDGRAITDDMKLSKETVRVIGGKSAVESIQEVRGFYDVNRHKGQASEIDLLAFDKNGETVAVTVEPKSVTGKLNEDADITKKQVPIVVAASNEQRDMDYSYEVKPDMVTITGEKDVLKTISEISVPIDVANLEDGMKVHALLTLPKRIIAASVEQVEVTVKIRERNGQDQSVDKTEDDSSTTGGTTSKNVDKENKNPSRH
ncbi:hypothetical protein D3H64_07485 [Atopobacter sp. AH10]|uniref:CdaR family protein n=1 Tax=Atopobacter sp. AH10 TaxID=2315861 RepID=UPI000EF2641B|nr:CdaR family protein [Atopobacter sp. AH10]RLK62911.1 hypothetical protein D3H64_07485 [Atopobacter sp. AH10]